MKGRQAILCKGDESGGAVQAQFAEGQAVILPMSAASTPHGGVGQHSSQLWLILVAIVGGDGCGCK
jgi:hypothetical protein